MKILKYNDENQYQRWLDFFRRNIGYRWELNGKRLEKWEAFSLIENKRITEYKLRIHRVPTEFCFRTLKTK